MTCFMKSLLYICCPCLSRVKSQISLLCKTIMLQGLDLSEVLLSQGLRSLLHMVVTNYNFYAKAHKCADPLPDAYQVGFYAYLLLKYHAQKTARYLELSCLSYCTFVAHTLCTRAHFNFVVLKGKLWQGTLPRKQLGNSC